MIKLSSPQLLLLPLNFVCRCLSLAIRAIHLLTYNTNTCTIDITAECCRSFSLHFFFRCATYFSVLNFQSVNNETTHNFYVYNETVSLETNLCSSNTKFVENMISCDGVECTRRLHRYGVMQRRKMDETYPFYFSASHHIEGRKIFASKSYFSLNLRKMRFRECRVMGKQEHDLMKEPISRRNTSISMQPTTFQPDRTSSAPISETHWTLLSSGICAWSMNRYTENFKNRPKRRYTCS